MAISTQTIASSNTGGHAGTHRSLRRTKKMRVALRDLCHFLDLGQPRQRKALGERNFCSEAEGGVQVVIMNMQLVSCRLGKTGKLGSLNNEYQLGRGLIFSLRDAKDKSGCQWEMVSPHDLFQENHFRCKELGFIIHAPEKVTGTFGQR